ncbi:uncharacterized protein B0P05DRAFT_545950 [Gilbertella persicaria]|uniref:uncharacterized protein n=1 Tax=Gilbertella persicaria TaxID=101096 RepID=UPI00221FFE37|nr:uncharacterized protein B0P05DRAFT_545950 [Gilbertella persicaria]KAI8076465.1 hypothetical protein B0P05DRAFT_545950 [Gilbertella persicaria]
MAKKAKARVILVKLLSTAGTGYNYIKSRPRISPKLSLMKYDPQGNKLLLFIVICLYLFYSEATCLVYGNKNEEIRTKKQKPIDMYIECLSTYNNKKKKRGLYANHVSIQECKLIQLLSLYKDSSYAILQERNKEVN